MDPEGPVVSMETTLGEIRIQLYPEQAPITVENFLQYVEDGFYAGTIFHRVVRGFVIQGGGLTADMQEKPNRDPIRNEADNGLRNGRGWLSMARTSDPHSATSQFFINTVDNPVLDFTSQTPRGWGYAVFGRVISGMDVVDQIEGSPVVSRAGFNDVPPRRGGNPVGNRDLPLAFTNREQDFRHSGSAVERVGGVARLAFDRQPEHVQELVEFPPGERGERAELARRAEQRQRPAGLAPPADLAEAGSEERRELRPVVLPDVMGVVGPVFEGLAGTDDFALRSRTEQDSAGARVPGALPRPPPGRLSRVRWFRKIRRDRSSGPRTEAAKHRRPSRPVPRHRNRVVAPRRKPRLPDPPRPRVEHRLAEAIPSRIPRRRRDPAPAFRERTRRRSDSGRDAGSGARERRTD